MPDVIFLDEKGEKWIQSFLITITYWGTWGNGAGTAAKTDHAMFNEWEIARKATHKVKIADDTIKHTWTQTTIDLVTITEAGIYTYETGGMLIFHASFDGIALNEGDSIGFTLTDEQT